MHRGIRKISREIYERNKDHGFLSEEDEKKVFSKMEILGYGVYWTQVFTGDDGEFYVRFERGDTCD